MVDDSRAERFRVLFDAEWPGVLGYAARRTDPESAADVVADTFLVAWRRLDDIPPGQEARLWLFGVARRMLANHRRGEHRRGRLAERLRSQVVEILPQGWEDRSHDADLVHQALRGLDERDAELLRLTSWEGLTPAEIAAVLRVPAPTVRSRLHRARLRLVVELEALGWSGERSDPPGHVAPEGRLLLVAPEEAS